MSSTICSTTAANARYEPRFASRLSRPAVSCSAAMAEETCKANEELIDYKNVQDIARMLRVEAALRLEAVVGGPLPLPADYAKIQD